MHGCFRANNEGAVGFDYHAGGEVQASASFNHHAGMNAPGGSKCALVWLCSCEGSSIEGVANWLERLGEGKGAVLLEGLKLLFQCQS